jgi:hypothetical protein
MGTQSKPPKNKRKKIDWEQRKYEIATHIMASLMADSKSLFSSDSYACADRAVRCANVLIGQLKIDNEKELSKK